VGAGEAGITVGVFNKGEFVKGKAWVVYGWGEELSSLTKLGFSGEFCLGQARKTLTIASMPMTARVG